MTRLWRATTAPTTTAAIFLNNMTLKNAITTNIGKIFANPIQKTNWTWPIKTCADVAIIAVIKMVKMISSNSDNWRPVNKCITQWLNSCNGKQVVENNATHPVDKIRKRVLSQIKGAPSNNGVTVLITDAIPKDTIMLVTQKAPDLNFFMLNPSKISVTKSPPLPWWPDPAHRFSCWK